MYHTEERYSLHLFLYLDIAKSLLPQKQKKNQRPPGAGRLPHSQTVLQEQLGPRRPGFNNPVSEYSKFKKKIGSTNLLIAKTQRPQEQKQRKIPTRGIEPRPPRT
jgi:hypothetical protein